MQPTPRACDLAVPISDALRLIRGTLRPDEFDPATADQVFTIAMNDYSAFVLLPLLLARLSIEAPHVDVRVRGTFGRDEAVELLDSGEASLAIGFPVEVSARILTRSLLQEDFSCVARPGHPAFADGASVEDFAAASHLLVSREGDRASLVDRELANLGLERRVALSLPQFLVAPFVIAETDLVATVASRVARRFAASGLSRLPAIDRTGEDAQDLTLHNCINLRLPTRDSLLPWELRKGRRELQVRVEGQLTFNSVYQMMDAALGGFGLAYVPKDLAEVHVRAGRLNWVLEDWFPTFVGHHVYYPGRRKSSRAVELVVDALKSGYQRRAQ
ncbi:DNA-binding transcriptional LysR family regulator [Paraburkholderia sp. Cpub6]|nr:DNA-binding transcriptional LysR family regulator [Paraburkholderia sp. Cpub6]